MFCSVLRALASGYERTFGLGVRNRRLLASHAELEAEIKARQQVEQALVLHRASLEQQVEVRTRELVAAHDQAQRANRARVNSPRA